MINRVKFLLGSIAILMMTGIVMAQPDIFNPSTWFVSQEAVFLAASLITPWIVKIVTALGKDWFSTDGKSTIWLSAGVAAVIAGVGGYLSLGYFADVSGLAGAVNAAILTIIAFLGSNGMAKNERQVATAAMTRSVAGSVAVMEVNDNSVRPAAAALLKGVLREAKDAEEEE